MSTGVDKNANTLLDIVVGSMDQGVLVVAADLSVPVLNVRATELLDLPTQFSIDLPTFPEILAYQVEVGAISSAYMKSSINDFILRGDQLTQTHTYTRKTKTGRWLDVRTTPLPNGGFVRTFTDQTERHSISAAKRQADDAYKALFNNATIGIYRTSVDGNQLRANPELVALNGYDSETDMLRAFGNIATEWYVDPNRRAEFKEILDADGRVTEFESEIYRHLTRERIWISESAWVVRDENGVITGYEGTVIEITERKKLESLINHAAHHDALTGLPNRAYFNQSLDEALASGHPFFLAYLDLDGFKAVNDTYGHGLGDELLVAIGARFTNALRKEEPVFRMGGDEFAVIFTDSDLRQVRITLARLVDALASPFKFGDITVEVGVSIGIASSSPDAKASDILHHADIGLYRAKGFAGSAVSFEGSAAPLDQDSRNSA